MAASTLSSAARQRLFSAGVPTEMRHPLGQLIAAHGPHNHAQLLEFVKHALAVADAHKMKFPAEGRYSSLRFLNPAS